MKKVMFSMLTNFDKVKSIRVVANALYLCGLFLNLVFDKKYELLRVGIN